jgi:hypothetical protein
MEFARISAKMLFFNNGRYSLFYKLKEGLNVGGNFDPFLFIYPF